jgi:RNA polymerase sigma-70 factor, ECF subfamily
MAADMDFEGLVNLYYPSLYRFALSLTHQDSDACDLTQQTFYIWARKGHQLQDVGKVKSWLFTTLHREFLQRRRRVVRFSDVELSEAEWELPEVPPPSVDLMDGGMVLDALSRLDKTFQAPIALFYLEDYSYQEIGQILEIPLGTVKSRISRGIGQLQRVLQDVTPAVAGKEAHD